MLIIMLFLVPSLPLVTEGLRCKKKIVNIFICKLGSLKSLVLYVKNAFHFLFMK